MPAVQNKKLANQTIVFREVGAVKGNDQGEFVIDVPKVAAELVNLGFVILPEPKLEKLVPDPTKVQKNAPSPAKQVESKLSEPVKPEDSTESKEETVENKNKLEDSSEPSSNKEDK